MNIEKKDFDDNYSHRGDIVQKLQSEVYLSVACMYINGEEMVFYLKRKESRDGINTFIEMTDCNRRISDS